jgi:hypothetical protein
VEEELEHQVGRRRLLRRAGVVVAGVAGAGVAGAVAATPASADTGQSAVLGQANTANETTAISLTGTVANPEAKAALRLTNAAGPVLTADPVDFNTAVTTAPPAGSIFVDDFGDFWTVGDVGGKFINSTYSPTWATMPFPVSPFRILDTRTTAGRANVVAGSASYDTAGRVITHPTTLNPDLVLDFSSILVPNYVAVQINLTVAIPVKPGWAAVWGEGDFPGTSSINFQTGIAIANFTQSELTGVFQGSTEPFGHLKLKASQNCAFIVDVLGFITPDPFALFTQTAQQTFGASGAAARRIPRKR